MKSISTLLIIVSVIQFSFAQQQNKGYIKYDLELSKAPTEMASLEKIEAKYGHTLEMAWNKGWALMRKNIKDNVDVYFLTDREEQNQNAYIHFLDTNDKIVFPIGKGFQKDFAFYKLLGKYEWIKTEEQRTMQNLSCRVYKLKVEAYPFDVNEWCISEENEGYFTYYPFYEGQSLGLPLSMIVGSSIKQKLTVVENSKNISDQLIQFKKEDFVPMDHNTFKSKNVLLYASIFGAI